MPSLHSQLERSLDFLRHASMRSVERLYYAAGAVMGTLEGLYGTLKGSTPSLACCLAAQMPVLQGQSVHNCIEEKSPIKCQSERSVSVGPLLKGAGNLMVWHWVAACTGRGARPSAMTPVSTLELHFPPSHPGLSAAVAPGEPCSCHRHMQCTPLSPFLDAFVH